MSGNARFQYELEPILLSRQWALDALKLDLSKVNEQLRDLRQQLSDLEKVAALTVQEWKQHSGGQELISIERHMVIARYMDDLAQQCSAKEISIKETDMQREQLIDQIAHAQRGLEAIEKHRSQMKENFTKLALSHDFKQADDHWSTLQSRAEYHGN
ncbi:hypothetical protein ACO0LO_10470 [Undibacterium sp. TJN25]|uniref:hypothetical protein n=1 Tax=Undibacterium sp. TJN25 TaxID=3413056 RepID=UPI003BEFA5FA